MTHGIGNDLTIGKANLVHLEIFESAGKVQYMAKICLGISIGAVGFGQLQLLGDGIELQWPQEENLTSN